jgi:tRNA1(Val) A37 N6-methylase TrmN6
MSQNIGVRKNIAQLILNIDTLMEKNGQLHFLTPPQRKCHWYALARRLGGGGVWVLSI